MLYGIPLLPLLFSVPFYVAAFFAWRKAKKFIENAQKTTGCVVSAEEKGRDLIVRIEYKDSLNKSHVHILEKEDGVSRQQKIQEKHAHDSRFRETLWKTGDTVDIFYNRNKPEEVVMGTPKMAYAPAIALSVFASFPIVFGVIPSFF
jgi:hypothetical protein